MLYLYLLGLTFYLLALPDGLGLLPSYIYIYIIFRILPYD